MLSVPPPLPALLQDMPALPRGRLGLRMPSRVQPAPAWPAAYTEAPHACARTHAGAERAHALVLPAAPHAPLTPAASSCKAVSQSASHSPIRNSKRGRAVGDCDKNASFRGRASPGTAALRRERESAFHGPGGVNPTRILGTLGRGPGTPPRSVTRSATGWWGGRGKPASCP